MTEGGNKAVASEEDDEAQVQGEKKPMHECVLANAIQPEYHLENVSDDWMNSLLADLKTLKPLQIPSDGGMNRERTLGSAFMFTLSDDMASMYTREARVLWTFFQKQYSTTFGECDVSAEYKGKFEKIVFHIEGVTTALPSMMGATEESAAINTARRKKVISLPPESAHGVLFKRMIDHAHELLLSMGVDCVNKPVFDVTLNASTCSTMPHWDEPNHNGPGDFIVNFSLVAEGLLAFLHGEMNTGRSLYLPRDCVYGFSGKLRKRYTHSVWRRSLPPKHSITEALKDPATADDVRFVFTVRLGVEGESAVAEDYAFWEAVECKANRGEECRRPIPPTAKSWIMDGVATEFKNAWLVPLLRNKTTEVPAMSFLRCVVGKELREFRILAVGTLEHVNAKKTRHDASALVQHASVGTRTSWSEPVWILAYHLSGHRLAKMPQGDRKRAQGT